MAGPHQKNEELTEKEAIKRRDEALKRALNTLPKPHKQMDKNSKMDSTAANKKR